MPLTDRKIQNLKPGGKLRHFDGGGLYLEVAPSGGKWWRFKYRFDGKEKRISLGVYPDVPLAGHKDLASKQWIDGARDRRDAMRKLLAAGIDPGEKRKADKKEELGKRANSFEAVAREWYGKQTHVWSEKHAADVLRRLEANLFPQIGAKPIADLTAPELLSAVQLIEGRGARDLAHRVLQVAGQVCRYGIVTHRCTQDLSKDLRDALEPHKRQNQSAIKREELPALLRAIDGYADIGGDRLTALALKLLSLTFVRTGELIGAKWNEFDIDSGTWVIPATRMKMGLEHVVPLSSQAVAVLVELRAIGGGSDYVFPGRSLYKPISNNTMLFALYRLGYKGKMTGHGFRAVASTILNESGFRPDVIERQLAHIEQNKIRLAYNHAEYLPERRQMMQQWAGMLDDAAKPERKVTPIKSKTAA